MLAAILGPTLYSAGILRNRTAAVLIIAWWLAETTGDSLPLEAYRHLDLIAVTLILFWRTRREDWLVALIYVPMRAIYGLEDSGHLSPALAWWMLLYGQLVQLILAGPWPFFASNRTEAGRRSKRFFPALVKGEHV